MSTDHYAGGTDRHRLRPASRSGGRGRVWCCLARVACLAAVLGDPSQGGWAAELTGSLRAHDPSTLVRCGNEYWCFYTGPGCRSKVSTNLLHWEEGPRVFAALPEWTRQVTPGNRGQVWAPDVIFLNGRYHLYYSVSEWGKNTSAIGLATNPTLDPQDPSFRWRDDGVVVQSWATNDFNAIDPALFRDADSTLWMAFGSFWKGIKLVQLDPRTGHRIVPDSPLHPLAWNSSIEAACLCRHGDFYYLFVNWDSCCRGLNSGYNIRLGRSRRITGPYLDREGKAMSQGGGTLFLEATGRYIGPGHAGVFRDHGLEWFTYTTTTAKTAAGPN